MPMKPSAKLAVDMRPVRSRKRQEISQLNRVVLIEDHWSMYRALTSIFGRILLFVDSRHDFKFSLAALSL